MNKNSCGYLCIRFQFLSYDFLICRQQVEKYFAPATCRPGGSQKSFALKIMNHKWEQLRASFKSYGPKGLSNKPWEQTRKNIGPELAEKQRYLEDRQYCFPTSACHWPHFWSDHFWAAGHLGGFELWKRHPNTPDITHTHKDSRKLITQEVEQAHETCRSPTPNWHF